MTDDERAIRELVNVWLAASKAGDLQTILSLMTDDVIFMVPGRRPFGKEAFAAASQGMQNVTMEGASDIQEIQVLGDWAYLRNYIEMVVTPPNGAPVRRSGYTLTILRKESDGRWRLARDANLLTEAKLDAGTLCRSACCRVAARGARTAQQPGSDRLCHRHQRNDDGAR
jgi:uncharacterized protein (TIGR02246 family)